MRTTLNIPDDVYEVISSFADSRKVSLGEALGVLVRQGLNPATRNAGSAAGFPTFRVSPSANPITLERTLAAEDEL